MMINDNGHSVPAAGMPSNQQAEQVLLGAILLDNAKLAVVAPLLAPARFSDPINGVIYAAICRIVEAGITVDAALLRAEFDGTDILDEVGGARYLRDLETQHGLGRVDIRNYAESIHDAWVRRELISVAEHLHALAADAIQGAYGEAVSDFGEATGVDQAGYVASRLRGLLASVDAAAGKGA